MSRIGITVLAAGMATRFGRQKLTALWRGEPILFHALKAAQGAFPGNVHLVAGADCESITDCAGSLADFVHINPDYSNGMGTSIATAADACHTRYDALIVALGDQPLITADHYRDMVSVYFDRADCIVATRFSSIVGPPTLFGRDYFDGLASLRGDVGAKSVIAAHAQSLDVVDFEPASVDIDTPADLAALDRR